MFSALALMLVELISGGEIVLNDWTLSSCDNKFSDVIANVPGFVNTDLINAGLIPLDPYYRYNELNMSWVAKECWVYTSGPFSFDLQHDLFTTPLRLNLENVDTAAEIFLNGVQIGYCENSFRPHSITIPTALVKESNVLTVKMLSSLGVALSKANKYPYPVPETLNYNVWAEPSNRNFIRKTGSDMGWDWVNYY